jgi:hypothetical protein
VSLPEQLLLSDLLRRRVRCDRGIDHGSGVMAWMHPPVHRLLGWISKPSAFGDRRQAWRLDQLRGLSELELFVQGDPADTDLPTVDRLPTLMEATLLDRYNEPIGVVADAAVALQSGKILHYLISRSDPRLPGSSRWRLTPERIVDQQPDQVMTGLRGLDDLPLARASVRQELLRRSRRWRDQFQEAGDRFEQRLEGWLDDGSEFSEDPGTEERRFVRHDPSREAWDDWESTDAGASRRQQSRSQWQEDDPWL